MPIFSFVKSILKKKKIKKNNDYVEIIIAHISNTYSYGAMMLATNFIEYFVKSTDKKVIFYVDALTDDHIKRLRDSTQYYNIHSLPYKYKNKPKSLFLKFIFKIYKKLLELKEMKNRLVIFIGGDDFSEIYGNILYELIFIYLASKRTKIILFGQTVGPFYKWRKKLVSFVMNKIEIYTRDALTYRYLKNLNINEMVTESRDIAFLPLPLQNQYKLIENKILKSYQINKEQYITLVPSGLWRHYTYDYNRYLDFWLEIIKYIYEKYPTKKIVLLAHVVKPDSDIPIIINIYKRLNKTYRDRISVITSTILPVEARLILTGGYFSISGRMHPVISTFQMGKPSIALGYSPKFQGVLAEGVNVSRLVLEASTKDFWERQYPYKAVCDAINYLENNYEELCDTIKANSDKNANLVLKHVGDIAKNVVD